MLEARTTLTMTDGVTSRVGEARPEGSDGRFSEWAHLVVPSSN